MQNLTTEQTIVLEAVYTILERNAQASMIKRFLDLLTPEAKKTYIEIQNFMERVKRENE